MLSNVIFLNSHPIQYFAPLYQEIERRKLLNLTVLYCSAHGVGGETDREFGVQVKWDIPVLEGYRSVFLKNHARKPGIYGFWSLLNWGVVSYLRKAPKSIIVVHGWGYATNWLALLAGRLFGHTVCLRGESPDCHERLRSPRSLALRKLLFGNLLFRLPHYFLFIGRENAKFYTRYGVAKNKLLFAPYAVDNQRFGNQFQILSPRREALKKELGLPTGKTIVLASGKYIEKKRPLDLLRAFSQCNHREDACLVFMGEGELRSEMERFIAENQLGNVHLTGFVNQSKVPSYYAVADLFVMCSGEGETWGLSTNEAMNFRLPVLLSDLTGSSSDLVLPGENGEVFKTGNVDELAEKLNALLSLPPSRLREMGEVSAERIKGYGYEQIIESLKVVAGNEVPSSKPLTRSPAHPLTS